MKTTLFLISAPLLALSLLACDSGTGVGLNVPKKADLPEGTIGDNPDGDDDPTNDGNQNNESGGEDNTFDHPDGLGDEGRDPFEVLAERLEEGAPEIRTRMHSCQKMQNAALGKTLVALGVDMAATGNPAPAGQLFNEGQAALGGANYVARNAESKVWTNSGATKFQDIWTMAASEIIVNLPTVEHCQIDGEGVQMFDEDDQCNEAAVTCLIGRPATDAHLAVCNQAVATSASVDQGKIIAVASMLAAAHTCE